ncbi:NACHT domain-containing protein [Leisingera caerulea]|uniref:NACHT domain-containing protein n=1 Tax=Leisingera caerulea TaxID=506591 RepID=A0ABY5WZ78_LEICA|nr:NACHT domain-containing protein [Leisingera caerulea]UWQ59339.1 NACHT domain-containing protein [Leisingera caerulea]
MAISEGLAVNGITALAGQISKRFIQRYYLPYRMRRRLAGRKDVTENEQILDALQRAIGNFKSLTPATNSTLLDIANSNLLEHLIAIVGSDLDQKNAMAVIEYIHRSRGGATRKESTDFAKNLSDCLRTISESTAETVRREASGNSLLTWQKRRDDDARRAESVINGILHKLQDKEGEWIEHAEVSAEIIAKKIEDDRDPLKSYVTALKRTMNSVDVHGASGDVVQVPLDEIYVDVPVSIIDRKKNFNPYQDLRKNIARHRVADDWERTLDFINDTVLLGDPGGGKSTLSKKLCLESCNRYLGGQTKLPIYIQLRIYIAKAVEDDRLSLKHYIFDLVSSSLVDADEQDLTSTILYHLRIGAVFFVADGLDEVLTTSNRARVVQEITAFRKEFPLCQILVTSRYVGYETQPLDGFTHLGVDHLNNSGIEQIYRNVSSTVLKRCDREVEARLQAFLIDSRKKARELIRSPLLLTLIVIIYDKKSEIPDNRANLYAFCADLLFDQWDGYRDITPDLPERYRLFDLFKHLSALLYENEEYGGTIVKDDLIKEARDFFKSDYIDNREGRSAAAARHMVAHLTGRAWILHEVGENIFEFTHRTFMEYFYAKFLDTEFEDTTSLVNSCLEHVLAGQRTLPTHLALQIRTNNKRAASTKVAEALTIALKKHPRNNELLDFSLDSLGYILPNGDQLRQLVSTLAEPAIFSRDSSAPIRLLCTQNPLRNNILNISFEQLGQVKTVDQLRGLEAAFQKMRREQTSQMTDQKGKTIDIVDKVIERMRSKQAASPYVCKLAFDLDSKVNWNAARKFGIRLWINAQSELGHLMRLLHDSRAMLKDASKFVLDADAHTGKHLKLARAIYPTFMRAGDKSYLDLFYLRHYRHETLLENVDYSTDLTAWREDSDALEIFAFTLMLYAETHFELLDQERRKKVASTISNICDALDGVNSTHVEYCRAWLRDEKTLVLHPESLRHSGSFTLHEEE